MSTSDRTRESPFGAYARLLVDLHRLISLGKGDDSEADEIRDEMDDPWRHMSAEEQDLVDGLSADLYSIGVDRQKQGTLDAKDADELQDMIDSDKWNGLLEFLRRHESVLPPDEVACLRGIAWGRMSQHEAAFEFFDEAVRLVPTIAKYHVLAMQARIRAGRSAEALPQAEEIIQSSDDPSKLLMAAHVVLDCIRGLAEEQQLQRCHRVIDVVRRAQRLAGDVTHDDYLRTISAFGHLYAAECYARLGERQPAIDSVKDAAEVDPGNPVVQDWLRELVGNESLLSCGDLSHFPTTAGPITFPHLDLSIGSV